MNSFFSDKIRDLDQISGMSLINKNKNLIQECHRYIQSFTNQSTRDNIISERGNEINNRMAEAQQNMKTFLDGDKPEPLDFTDKPETTITATEMQKKMKKYEESRDNIKNPPKLKINHQVQVERIRPIKKVQFKKSEFCIDTDIHANNKIEFGVSSLNNIQIHSILFKDREVNGVKNILGQNMPKRFSEYPLILVSIYINDKVKRENVCFFNNQSGGWVKFESKNTIELNGSIDKIELHLYDHNKNELFLGRDVETCEKLDNVKMIGFEDSEQYTFLRMRNVAAGDFLQSSEGRTKVEAVGTLTGSDETGANLCYIATSRGNCAILREDITGPLVNYGQSPILYFTSLG